MSDAIPMSVRSIMRPSAAQMVPYDPHFTPVSINLSANENTHGLDPETARDLVDALARVKTNRYPDPMANDLRAELAKVEGVSPSQVIVGNGGDELIFNLFLAFGGAGARVVTCPPCFSVYGLYAELVDCQIVTVPRDANTFEVDADALVAAARSARVVCLTSPNNPTGTLIRPDIVRAVCEACPGIVLADEAYIEFAPKDASARPLVDEFDNLVILHTFSKAYCLAGARVGYVIASEGVISALAAVRQPYSVSSLDQAAARVALAHREQAQVAIDDIVRERERLSKSLSELPGVRVWPSAANFLFVHVAGAHRIWERLRDECSILVRDFSSDPASPECLRISVGTRDENDRLIDALTLLTKE